MTGRRFVVNASPLILLARIDALDLLHQLAEEVAVPAAVLAEVRARPGQATVISESVERGELQMAPDARPPEEIAGWDLGRGESQVLTFALANPLWEAVLDDLEARRCARSLNVPVTGTLGVILRSKQAGLIQAARPLVEELVREGAYLARDLIDTALAKVGE